MVFLAFKTFYANLLGASQNENSYGILISCAIPMSSKIVSNLLFWVFLGKPRYAWIYMTCFSFKEYD